MRWRPVLVALITLLVTLSVAAWFSAPWWLPLAVERQLAGHGFALRAMEIDRIGWHETSLSRLHIRQTEGDLEINARGINAGYDLGRLIDGRLDSLEIDRLQLHLHASPERHGGAGPALFAPAGLLASVPIAQLRIEAMSIRWLGREGQLLRRLAGQASLRNGALAIELKEPDPTNPLQARLTLDRTGRLQAGLMRGNESIVRLTALIRESGELLTAEAEMHVELAALGRLAGEWIGMPELHLQGSLDSSWRGSLPVRTEPEAEEIRRLLAASAGISLQAKAVMPNSGDHIRLVLDADIGYGNGNGSWQVADHSRLFLGPDGDQLQLAPSMLSGSFELLENVWRIGVNREAGIETGKLQLGDISLAAAAVRLLQPATISLATGTAPRLETPASVALQLPAIRFGKNRVATRDLRLTFDRGPLTSPTGRFKADGLSLAADSVTIPATTLSGSFDLSHEPWTANGALTDPESRIRLDWRLRHRPAGRTGTLSYILQPVQFGAGAISIARFIETRDKYAVEAGRLSGGGEMEWRNGRISGPGHRLNLELASLQGFYGSNAFSGLNGQLQVAVDGNTLSLASDNLVIGELHAGIPIRNLTLSAAIRQPFAAAATISIDRLRGEVLGGSLSSEHIDIDLARASNPFVINLERLDAGQIAEIHKQEGLHADGILDGTLPLDWTEEGLRLVHGRLQARAPGGVIRYQGTESVRNLAGSDRTTSMALDILSDLRYRQLLIGLDAEPDGEMSLRIELKGYNPTYENGRPIEFNLNIEENVLKLLYSLRMADEIGNRLEQQMQKKARER